MDKFNKPRNNETSENLQIWCCGHCEEVHFKAGKVLLNFTKEEFAELTHSVNDVFQQQFGNLEFYNLINLVTKNEDVLLSDTIS